jgi:endo-alpha-1,4-polygalactosaminidase (GH114 family)
MIYSFSQARQHYTLDVTSTGTKVTDQSTGVQTIVPFGESMDFAGVTKYSKDTQTLIHHVRSHVEAYDDINSLVDLPVDFLRTGAAWQTGANAYQSSSFRLSDRSDKVIVAYINSSEFTAVGGWDWSFNSAWDKDGDAKIDADVTNLPAYVDTKVFNATWKNYVAAFWTDAWHDELKKKIDEVATQNFDGIMLDVMTPAYSWKEAYPQMDLHELQLRVADMFRWASTYAKTKYGSEFVVTANLDAQAYTYFPDMGKYIDAGYYQNAYFNWNGDGTVVSGALLSTTSGSYSNPSIDFLKQQGIQVLDMDHLGTGPVSAGLDFVNYDDRITDANLHKVFAWAMESGSTPYVAPVFFGKPFSQIPHFVRIDPSNPKYVATKYNDWIIGSTADDVVTLAGGRDVFDGGAGLNSVICADKRSNFTIVKTSSGFTVTDKAGALGSGELSNVQKITFSDLSVNLTVGSNAQTISSANLKTLEELYVAFFNRVPDADGLNYWITQFKNGQSISNIADSFYSAAVQYSAITGYSSTMTNADFVKVIYKNVLGRSGDTAPPDADVNYWAGELANGHATKGTLVSTMLDSAHTFKGNSQWGWVADLLDNKAVVANYVAVQQGVTYNSATDSITNGMAIAAAVTSTDTAAAIALVGISDSGFTLG